MSSFLEDKDLREGKGKGGDGRGKRTERQEEGVVK
jgi:hypothetical protein